MESKNCLALFHVAIIDADPDLELTK